MRFHLRSSVFAVLFLLSAHVYAAQDPVTWTVDHALENPVFSGRTYTQTYTFTSHLPATMVQPLVIIKNANPTGEFSYNDTCTGAKLSPAQSCNVQVTFKPVTSGTKSLQLAMAGYDNNVVKLPVVTTQATGQVTQTVYGLVSQALPNAASAGVADQYAFTFTNPTSATVTNVAVNVTQSNGAATFTTTCGSSLAAFQSCRVSGNYTPSTSSSVQSVAATLNYGQNQSATAATSTTVTSSTGVIGSIVGNFYLPAVMAGGGASQTLWFIFTNVGPGSATVTTSGTPVTVTVGGGTGSVTPVFNHCTSATLAVGAQCDIQVTFQATSVGSPTPVTVEADVSYTGSTSGTASVSTSTNVLSTISTSRTLSFQNNCDFPVWFSLNGGALKNSPTCASDSDCPTAGAATKCSALTHTCFWTNQVPNGPGSSAAPAASSYKLDARGGTVTTNTVTIPLTAADPAIQWSGNISASLGCNGTSCLQADCSNGGGTTACLPGQGFLPPATQAEITMSIATNDSYDVEVINGFHIPIAMAPTQYSIPNGYYCGAPGGASATNGFGACNWTGAAVPPGNGYNLVTSGGASCNINTPSCSTVGQVCGLDLGLNQVCGDFLGYWTADQVCGMSNVPAAVNTFFNCSTPLSSIAGSLTFPGGSTLYDLMACAVPTGDTQSTFNSCYLTYSGNPSNNQIPCCGCIDWWTVSGINANNTAQSCQQAGQSSAQTDPVWNNYIQGTVAWLKKACPSDYVYPFDDKTSGFSCTDTLPGQPNSQSYTVTFCPGNDTGLPTSVTEGRV